MKRVSFNSAALTLVLLIGCGTSNRGGVPAEPDGGAALDGKAAASSGVTVDGGGTPDRGVTTDGGVGPDRNASADAQVAVDGSVAADVVVGADVVAIADGRLAADGNAIADGSSVVADVGLPGPRSDGSAPTTAGSATCLDVIQCVSACSSSDATCPAACDAKGSPEAHTVALALLQCLVNKCTDSDPSCAETACSNEVTACAKQTAAATPPGTGPDAGISRSDAGPDAESLPPGNGPVPASLVGTWSSASSYGAMIYEFRADGSAFYSLRYRFVDGFICNVDEENLAGRVIIAGTTMVLDFTDGNKVSGPCGTVAVPTPISPSQSTYTWRLGTDSQGHTELFINDGSGETGYIGG